MGRADGPRGWAVRAVSSPHVISSGVLTFDRLLVMEASSPVALSKLSEYMSDSTVSGAASSAARAVVDT